MGIVYRSSYVRAAEPSLISSIPDRGRGRGRGRDRDWPYLNFNRQP